MVAEAEPALRGCEGSNKVLEGGIMAGLRKSINKIGIMDEVYFQSNSVKNGMMVWYGYGMVH